jgi:hypothetical protein
MFQPNIFPFMMIGILLLTMVNWNAVFIHVDAIRNLDVEDLRSQI